MVYLKEMRVGIQTAGLEGGEIDPRLNDWAEYAVYNIPGHNVLSGRYTGPEAIAAVLQRRQQALAEKQYQVVVTRTSTTESHVVVFTQVYAEVHGRSYAWQARWLYFLKDGQINGCWLFVDDLKTFDAFWNARPIGLSA